MISQYISLMIKAVNYYKNTDNKSILNYKIHNSRIMKKFKRIQILLQIHFIVQKDNSHHLMMDQDKH
jgi:hypothetical protein